MSTAAGYVDGDENEEDADDSWYICLTCNRAFVKDTDLSTHRKQQHESKMIKVLMVSQAELLPSIRLQHCRLGRTEHEQKEVNTAEVGYRRNHGKVKADSQNTNRTRTDSKPSVEQKTKELYQRDANKRHSRSRSWRDKTLIFNQDALLPWVMLQRCNLRSLSPTSTNTNLNPDSADLPGRSDEHNSSSFKLDTASTSTSRHLRSGLNTEPGFTEFTQSHKEHTEYQIESTYSSTHDNCKKNCTATTSDSPRQRIQQMTHRFKAVHVVNGQQEQEMGSTVRDDTAKRKSNEINLQNDHNKRTRRCQQKTCSRKKKHKSKTMRFKSFKCNLCFKIFSGIGGLKAHLLIMHIPQIQQLNITTTKVEESLANKLEINDVDEIFPLIASDDESAETENAFTETTSSTDDGEKTQQIVSVYENIKQNYESLTVCAPSGKGPISQEKKFTCEFCSREYKREAILSLHVKIFHSKHANSITDHIAAPTTNGLTEFEYQAASRDMRAAVKTEPKDSIVRKHQLYKCSQCTKAFWFRYKLNAHIRYFHQGQTFTCKYCDTKLSRNDHLQHHIKRIHPEVLANNFVTSPAHPCLNPKLPNIQLDQPESISIASRTRRPRNQQPNLYFEQDSNEEKAVSAKDSEWSENEDVKIDHYEPVKSPVSSDTGTSALENEQKINNRSFPVGRSVHKIGRKSKHPWKKALHNHLKQFHVNEETSLLSVSSTTELFEHDSTNNTKLAVVHWKHKIPPGSFICEICGQQLRSLRGLDTHMFVHTIEKDFICTICGMSFKHARNVKNHSRRVHEEKKCACDICGRPYATTREVELHKESHKNTTELKLICLICGKPCLSQQNLRRHMVSHNENRPHQCTECSASFKKTASLKRHRLSLHGDRSLRPHQCAECGKCFKLTVHLAKHSKSHNAVRKHVCEICSTSYKTGQALKRHQTMHKPPAFECKVCNRKFTQNCLLKRHEINSHLSDAEKKYECSVCGKKFGWVDKLKQHAVSHQEDEEKKFQCTLCGKKFGLPHHLRQHLPTHNLENPDTVYVGRKSRTGANKKIAERNDESDQT